MSKILFITTNVLIDLHRQLSINKKFVLNRKEWDNELDALGRNRYEEYIKQSYDKCLAHDLIGYDYLFTVDYEYASKLSQTVATQRIRDIRDDIMSKVMFDSPFECEGDFEPIPQYICFRSTNFLAKVDPILPVAHKQEAISILKSCYTQMDTEF